MTGIVAKSQAIAGLLQVKKTPTASAAGREKRRTRATGLINKLISAPQGRIILFSDEKNFVVDPTYNPQNDRWIRFQDSAAAAGDAEEAPVWK